MYCRWFKACLLGFNLFECLTPENSSQSKVSSRNQVVNKGQDNTHEFFTAVADAVVSTKSIEENRLVRKSAYEETTQ